MNMQADNNNNTTTTASIPTTGSIIQYEKPSETFFNRMSSWLSLVTHYNSLKEYLVSKYRSPYVLHSAHDNVLEHVDSILKDLSNIKDAIQKLRRKEELLEGLLQHIETPYKSEITLQEQLVIDNELENTFLNVKRSPYDHMSSETEKVSNYLMNKLYLSFISDVESKIIVTNSNINNPIKAIELFPFIEGSKGVEENIPTDFCKNIYNEYLLGLELPLPSLITLLYIESTGIQGKPLHEVQLFGDINSKESSIIQFWKSAKGSYKMWISAMCGRTLAYLSLCHKREDEVNEVLSKIKSYVIK